MCICFEQWRSVWCTTRTRRMENLNIFSACFRTNILYSTLLSQSFNMSHPSHISWFNRRNGARWRVHTTKLFTVHMVTYVMHRLSQDASHRSTKHCATSVTYSFDGSCYWSLSSSFTHWLSWPNITCKGFLGRTIFISTYTTSPRQRVEEIGDGWVQKRFYFWLLQAPWEWWVCTV
jgi:hypothetical protein